MSSFTPVLAASSSSSSSGSLFPLLMIIVVVGLFFFMSRGQRRNRQRLAELQRSLVPGQQVMTGSGIYGTIVSAIDDRVELEIAPGTVITVAKQAVSRTVEQHELVPQQEVATESAEPRLAE